MTTDKEKKAKQDARIKRAQRVVEVDGERWIIQGNPNNKKAPDLHAWPAAYKQRRHAPASVEYDPAREDRPFSVTIVDKLKSNRRPAVYRSISRMHYKTMDNAISSAIRHRDKIAKIIEAQDGAQAAAA